MKQILVKAVRNALAMALYVIAVASCLFYAHEFAGPRETETVLIPITMLLLLVFSAALSGLLLFGQPILWYLDGKKKEAISLLTITLGTFFLILLTAAFVLFLYSRTA